MQGLLSTGPTLSSFNPFQMEIDSSGNPGSELWDEWLTYLEPSHVHIDKECDFTINLEFHYDQLNVCFCFSCTGGLAVVMQCFELVLTMSDKRVCHPIPLCHSLSAITKPPVSGILM